ncbi:hypothetical protein F0562_017117 [Nyssa sinensis]|uniref:Disease resistance N-terminal domain-containing protein n=1 Tax=Nyssa sinensis TaxID=561372 RepID=A0A5J4ZEW0_9ASTE|nr:hypothetical protein F0562_017117 [Nyssa sinensis]
MAESFVFDIAENVLGKLGSVALREIRLARGVKSELAKLKDTLLTIKVVLLDAEEQQRTNDRVSIWLRKLEAIFYDADDVFDEFGYEALQQEVAYRGTTMEKVKKVILKEKGFYSTWI